MYPKTKFRENESPTYLWSDENIDNQSFSRDIEQHIGLLLNSKVEELQELIAACDFLFP